MSDLFPAVTSFSYCIHILRSAMRSFTCVLSMLWLFETCSIGLFVDCAVLAERQPFPDSLASSPNSSSQSSTQIFEISACATYGSLLIISDTTAGVTLVTKVIAVTSFLGSWGASPTTDASDQPDADGVATKVVRVGVTTANTVNCQPLLCSINVAVSNSLPFRKLR